MFPMADLLLLKEGNRLYSYHLKWDVIPPTNYTTYYLTSPSITESPHLLQQLENQGQDTKVFMSMAEDMSVSTEESDAPEADELTVSLGKTVDCIVSSEGEYSSTTIQSTTSASRTAPCD